MSQPRKKPLATLIEYSPTRRKRIERGRRRQERAWQRKGGPVVVRNIFDEEDIIYAASRSIVDGNGVFSLDDLVAELDAGGCELSRSVIRSHVRDRMSVSPSEAKGPTRLQRFEALKDGRFRLL